VTANLIVTEVAGTQQYGTFLTAPGPAATVQAGPAGRLPRDQVLSLLAGFPAWQQDTASRRNQHHRRMRGAAAVLDWLLTHPGEGWQERWLAAGAGNGTAWIAQIAAAGAAGGKARRTTICAGVSALLVCRVVLPGYAFINAYHPTGLRNFHRLWPPEVFARMDTAAAAHGMDQAQKPDGLCVITKVVLHTGKDIGQLTADDLLEYREWYRGVRGRHGGSGGAGQRAAWDLLRGIGVLPRDAVLEYAQRKGQASTAEMVDHYQIRSQEIRGVLIRYLGERRPGLGYSSLRTLAGTLAGLFWADIERHHPGAATLQLPPEVTQAWKQRLAFLKTRPGQPRKSIDDSLTAVRAFYLDIQEWALEDPAWAQWAVPSPVRRGEVTGQAKRRKKTTSEVHQRVRDRLPHLPTLIASAERHRAGLGTFLAATKRAAIGDTFGHEGVTYRRITSVTAVRDPARYPAPQAWAENTATGEHTDVTRAEDDAFWTWAIIETLRHTGIRVEELMEITHLALISYRLPGTGELVPMLQIVPSKANEERLLLVSPELASVLAATITRLRNGTGHIPLVARYDPHERLTGPPLPHLFQRNISHAWRREVISHATVLRMLSDALARTGLRDHAGQPLRYTAHDFRRIFATEAVTGGLPVHIAARLLGHHSLATTQACLAVFQDDLVHAYRAFLAQRRAARPEAEYREPTDEEWNEFQQHFELRKVALGTCGRPYGSPCNHEHACVRCPMLRLDPRQRPRLIEIITNLTDRIAEARMNNWNGEAEGLRVSLQAARAKLNNLDRVPNARNTTTTHLEIPIIHSGTDPTRADPAR